jgi:DNA mismatch repair protein MutL
MGFRGEALASIRAVSMLNIITKTIDSDKGVKISFEATSKNVVPHAHNTGTTVSLKNLFYNIPARKKFLKSVKTEYLSCENIIKRIAIGNPNVGFIAFHNGKQTLNIPKANDLVSIERRLKKIVGKNFIENSTYISEEIDEYKVEGWISNEDYLRPQNDINFTYLNKRYLKDKILSHAVKVGYEDKIENKFPSYILFITTEPKNYDVNVHPAKLEVKFLDPRKIHSIIVNLIKNKTGQNEKLNFKTKKNYQDFKIDTQSQLVNNVSKIHVPKNSSFVPLTFLKNQILVFKYDENLAYGNIKKIFHLYLKDAFSDIASFIKFDMIIPEKIIASRDELDKIEKFIPKIEKYQINIERLTLESLVIRSVPDFMARSHNFIELLNKITSCKSECYLDAIIDFCSENTIYSEKFISEWSSKLNVWFSIKFSKLTKDKIVNIVELDNFI